MLALSVLIAALSFAESKTLALQICLDREGFSCNTIDGVWGRKCERALRGYLAARADPALPSAFASPEQAFDRLFAEAPDAFRIETVTTQDLAALTVIPESPAARARLAHMGYESIAEMFAERGHLSVRALRRMNPGVDWDHVAPGLRIVIPDFPSMDEELAAGDRGRPRRPKRPEAAVVRVSLSNFEITAYDAAGRCLALFPCSIAAQRAKVPAHGERQVTSYIARPNYTYTPDVPVRGKRPRYVWPSGPNCPVGIAWMGLDLPGYGIHGTPVPESIGFTGSHGCFRLANWNAARLYALCRSGTRVVIEP